MSERFVRINDPPDDVTDTGFGMMFAFDRSVGADEQAKVISIAADTSRATIVFRFFTVRLFKINYFISAFQPVTRMV